MADAPFYRQVGIDSAYFEGKAGWFFPQKLTRKQGCFCGKKTPPIVDPGRRFFFPASRCQPELGSPEGRNGGAPEQVAIQIFHNQLVTPSGPSGSHPPHRDFETSPGRPNPLRRNEVRRSAETPVRRPEMGQNAGPREGGP